MNIFGWVVLLQETWLYEDSDYRIVVPSCTWWPSGLFCFTMGANPGIIDTCNQQCQYDKLAFTYSTVYTTLSTTEHKPKNSGVLLALAGIYHRQEKTSKLEGYWKTCAEKWTDKNKLAINFRKCGGAILPHENQWLTTLFIVPLQLSIPRFGKVHSCDNTPKPYRIKARVYSLHVRTA